MNHRQRQELRSRILAAANREILKGLDAMAVAWQKIHVDPVGWRAALDDVDRHTETAQRLHARYDRVER